MLKKSIREEEPVTPVYGLTCTHTHTLIFFLPSLALLFSNEFQPNLS